MRILNHLVKPHQHPIVWELLNKTYTNTSSLLDKTVNCYNPLVGDISESVYIWISNSLMSNICVDINFCNEELGRLKETLKATEDQLEELIEENKEVVIPWLGYLTVGVAFFVPIILKVIDCVRERRKRAERERRNQERERLVTNNTETDSEE